MIKKNLLITLLIATFTIISVQDCLATSFISGGIRLNKKVTPMNEIKKKNIVIQSLDFSCGAAGLSTLLNYYLDDPIEEEEIILTLLETVPIEKVRARNGFSLLDLKTFAKLKGYKVTGYKMDTEFLKELNKPVLVPIKYRNYRHFVIVKGIVGGRVFIADPAAGNMSMKIFQFEKIWTRGIGLVVEAKNEDQSREYALKVKEHDLIVSDYKNIRNLVNNGLIRSAIYPNEYK